MMFWTPHQVCFDFFIEEALEKKTNKQKQKKKTHQVQQNNGVKALLMEKALSHTKREMTGVGKMKSKRETIWFNPERERERERE